MGTTYRLILDFIGQESPANVLIAYVRCQAGTNYSIAVEVRLHSAGIILDLEMRFFLCNSNSIF